MPRLDFNTRNRSRGHVFVASRSRRVLILCNFFNFILSGSHGLWLLNRDHEAWIVVCNKHKHGSAVASLPMFNPQHMDALGLKFAIVYTVTKQNPPSNIFDSRFKRSPMGAEQSRSATQRKPRRASTGETNVLIPPPPNKKYYPSSRRRYLSRLGVSA